MSCPFRVLLYLVLLLSYGATTGLQADEPARKIIIDQDAFGPATSNLQSIMMLIQAPAVNVLGITVTSGDGWRDESVAHTLRLLEIMGRTDIPVVPGAVSPLVNSPERTKRWEAIYGKLVYKGCWTEKWPDGATVKRAPYHAPEVIPPLPEGMPQIKADPRIAANFLIEKVHQYPHEVTIFAAGPLTDLALAIRLDPEFPALAKELVVMGGSFEPQGNGSPFSLEYLYTPRLEFNFRWDPEAAHIVFTTPWKRILQIPVDPTTKTAIKASMIDEIAQVKTPVTQYLKSYAEPGYPMWDELAAAVWLDPALVTKSSQVREDVDCSFTAGYGNTLSWGPEAGPGLGEQLVTVVSDVDVPKLEKDFVMLMQRATPPPIK